MKDEVGRADNGGERAYDSPLGASPEHLPGAELARYRALADNASDIIICLDLDLRRTYVSPSSIIVLGYEPEEMLGCVPGMDIFLQGLAVTGACFDRLRSGKTEREDMTCRLQHKAGHFVWIEGRLSLIRDPVTAEPASILCSLRDVSKQKAQEEKLLTANLGLEHLSRHLAESRDASEQASKAKSRFLASISHELRTPLNGILGYTQLLQIEGGLNPKQANRVNSMMSAGQHLLEMINRVLNISEIEAGHVEVRPLPTNLTETMKTCLDLLRPAAESKNLMLGQEAARDVPDRIVIDPIRLRQLLLNLIGNAVKYTNQGSVSVRALQVEPARLRLEVVDSGPGIAPEHRGRLFQDFERLIVDADCAVEGSGVGLAFSRRLVAAMGGSIGYHPNPAGGSIFWFELPIQADVQDKEADRSHAPQPQSSIAPQSLKVLVVDDIAINRDVASSFLQTAGHKVTCTRSGEEAVALAASMDLDLILMDVRMPGIGGLEATRRIRALTSPSSQIPIVALTAQAFAEDITACHAAGMDAHLIKPFTRTDLLTIMDKAQATSLERGSITPTASAKATALQSGKPPIIDAAAFQQTLSTLPPAKVASHFRALVTRAEAFLSLLTSGNGETPSGQELDELADAAHRIAGSAGVFGFTQLAATARDYEYAALHQSDELPRVSDALIETSKLSLLAMDEYAAQLE